MHPPNKRTPLIFGQQTLPMSFRGGVIYFCLYAHPSIFPIPTPPLKGSEGLRRLKPQKASERAQRSSWGLNSLRKQHTGPEGASKGFREPVLWLPTVVFGQRTRRGRCPIEQRGVISVRPSERTNE